MPLPKNGTEILYTDKHPYHGCKAGQVFGVVINRQGGILNVRLPNGDTDRLYWLSADGTSNPFYGAKSPRH